MLQWGMGRGVEGRGGEGRGVERRGAYGMGERSLNASMGNK